MPVGTKYGSVSSSRSVSRSSSWLCSAASVLRTCSTPEHAVDIALIDDQLVVIAGFELMQDLLERRVEVERFDAAARDHHVVDGNIFEVEQVQQDAAVFGRHEAARFEHDGAQFFGGEALVASAFRVDVQHAQHGVREQIDEPDERPRDAHQRRDDQAGRQRDLFGIRRADDFRRDLGENDDQERDDACRDRQHEVVTTERAQRDRRGQHRNDGVEQIVADQHDAQQLIRLREQPLRGACAERPLLARCFRRWRLSAIIAVSEMEKKPEQISSRKTAPICAHKGSCSTRREGYGEEKGWEEYSRAVVRRPRRMQTDLSKQECPTAPVARAPVCRPDATAAASLDVRGSDFRGIRNQLVQRRVNSPSAPLRRQYECIDNLGTRAPVRRHVESSPVPFEKSRINRRLAGERGVGLDTKDSVNLRIDARSRQLIDEAATVLGKTRTEFMIESARREAIDVVLDQRVFLLDAARYDAFVQGLDNPPPPGPKLRSLLRRVPAWQKLANVPACRIDELQHPFRYPASMICQRSTAVSRFSTIGCCTAQFKNESRFSRTYVVGEGTRVVGYYCLAAGAIARIAAPNWIRRNAPATIPVSVIGQLAVTREHARKGLGGNLLADALRGVAAASRSIGIRAVACVRTIRRGVSI